MLARVTRCSLILGDKGTVLGGDDGREEQGRGWGGDGPAPRAHTSGHSRPRPRDSRTRWGALSLRPPPHCDQP
ncbi:unnamed protein product [Rangifer tarandus platyrhynchus]|uniref:Uncharacterized protein n=1 Tax=Rangifer tarandus platyrhynchus TaxID=3082113 RepID=A0ABN8Z5C3_RANTA|nr:unnamed protein product [Rangifer tarandus platyrhynchus]